MYKSLLGAMLLASSYVSVAGEYSVSLGYTRFTIQPNGFWYQEGYSHKLNIDSPSFNLRYLFGDSDDSWQCGLQYTYIGRAKTWAMAIPDDNNYDPKNHSCYPPCLDLAEYKTRSTMQGISLLAIKNFSKYYIVTGVMAGYSTNHVEVYGWQYELNGVKKDLFIDNPTEVNYLPLLGIGYRFKEEVFVEVSLLPTTPKGGEYPAIFRNHSINISVGYKF
jgi:hypothetical protein